VVQTPEEWLKKAMAAKTASVRARYARRGLATRARIDKTTQAMLLRQLYLSNYEVRRFRQAYDVAKQAIALGVLPDVLHQDAARAALASGNVEVALGHLRIAVRRSPASRRAFHLWTLGSTLFLAHRYADAITLLARAARASRGEEPLYRAHLALARIASGEEAGELQPVIDELARNPSGQGYGRFILGHLAYAAGEWGAAQRYLDAFVKRGEMHRPAMAIALEPELRMARATLAKMNTH
jgi:tetratricopeptide (TPR) repeat protein